MQKKSRNFFLWLWDMCWELYFRAPFAVVFLSLVILFGGITAVYYSVEMTSTVQFCTSCHEMHPARDSWLASKHYNVPGGKRRAACRDCHLPPWSDPVRLLWEKAYHGAKDVTRHFTDSAEFGHQGYYFNMQAHAKNGVHNENCMKCHGDLYKKTYPDRDNIHAGLRKGGNFRCVNCHEGLVHMKYLPEEK